jgi:hypothetical protein
MRFSILDFFDFFFLFFAMGITLSFGWGGSSFRELLRNVRDVAYRGVVRKESFRFVGSVSGEYVETHACDIPLIDFVFGDVDLNDRHGFRQGWRVGSTKERSH